VDRTDDHRAWAARPAGSSVVARHDGRLLAAGTIAGASGEYGQAASPGLAPGLRAESHPGRIVCSGTRARTLYFFRGK